VQPRHEYLGSKRRIMIMRIPSLDLAGCAEEERHCLHSGCCPQLPTVSPTRGMLGSLHLTCKRVAPGSRGRRWPGAASAPWSQCCDQVGGAGWVVGPGTGTGAALLRNGCTNRVLQHCLASCLRCMSSAQPVGCVPIPVRAVAVVLETHWKTVQSQPPPHTHTHTTTTHTASRCLRLASLAAFSCS
jgi:hypothetical protein